VSEPRIPVFLAVGFWVASGLAVAGFTYVAFRETASGAVENFAVQGGLDPSLVAAGGLLSSELTPDKKTSLKNLLTPVSGTHPQKPFKPLERGKFNK
jgi:hypothetical protein